MKAFTHFLSFFFVAILGWVFGTLYPAPPGLIAQVYPQALAIRASDDFKSIQTTRVMNWSTLRTMLRESDARRLTDEAVHVAERAGHAITIEHAVDKDTEDAERQVSQTIAQPVVMVAPPLTPPVIMLAPPPASPTVTTATAQKVPLPAPAPAGTSSGVLAASMVQTQSTTTTTITTTQAVVPPGADLPEGFEAIVSLCPGMQISDAPAAEPDRHIANFSSLVKVNSDTVAIDPIRNACFSSGFGTRSGKLHKGLDFYNAAGGPILAAGDGTIIEMKYRDDYGNMILIDHGNGVYTRYAHLSSFHTGLALGSTVHAGDEIGLMGNTAGYPVPMHLHYELLLGDYKNPKASFGLTPHSPFEYKAAAL